MAYMAEVKPQKPAQLARNVFGISGELSQKEQVLQLRDRLKTFFREIGLRTTLGELLIDDRHFGEMAERATKNGAVGHYLPIDREKFVAILELAK